jgi:hypothetical protein
MLDRPDHLRTKDVVKHKPKFEALFTKILDIYFAILLHRSKDDGFVCRQQGPK